MNIDELFLWTTELSKKNMEAYKRQLEAGDICPGCGKKIDDEELLCSCYYESLRYPEPDYIDKQEF